MFRILRKEISPGFGQEERRRLSVFPAMYGTEKNETLPMEISYNRSKNADNKEKSFCA